MLFELILAATIVGSITLLSIALIWEVHHPKQLRQRQPAAAPRAKSLSLSPAQWFAIGGLLVSYLLYSFTASLSVSAAILLISLYLMQFKPQQQPSYEQLPSRHLTSFQSRAKTLPPHHPLRIKLLAMVGGDIRTADRLLQQCQKNHPGMDTEWYFDKVIYDLTRDRH